ncbi:MAG: hypothetical protein MUC62_01190 [Candidatus Thermoplasmatota archaeon]|jgi:hypothetical protein|nr:hypothetical protein [Candidatus Thermoplasmatota archaeon]
MERLRASITLLMLFAVLSLLLTDQASPIQSIGPSSSTIGRSASSIGSITFDGTITHKGTDLLYRAASGDILTERPGLEVATCSRNGVVAVTYGSDLAWTTEIAWRSTFGDNPNDPANVYSIAVADLLTDRAGDEIVTVDMDDSVELIWKDGSVWKHETIFRDTLPAQQMWLYEVAVGELPGTPPGLDVVSVGDAGRTFVSSRIDGKWKTSIIHNDTAALDTCIIDDIIPEIQGEEVAVGGKNGDIVLLSWDGAVYERSIIASLGSNVMDLVLADLEPNLEGPEVYSTTYSGGLYMTYRVNGSWQTDRVHFEGSPIYGIEKGTIEGDEVISMATWNYRIAILYHDSTFKVREVYRDDYLMMGTGIFDMDPYHKGNEIVGLSFYGRLHMFYHDEPGAGLQIPFSECVLTRNETIYVPLIIRHKGGFDGRTDLKVSGTGASLTENLIMTEGMVKLRMVAPPRTGAVTVTITASTTVSSDTKMIIFSVQNGTGGFMDFDRHTLLLQVGSDRQTGGTIELLSNKDMGTPFVLDATGSPMGLRLDLTEAVCDPLGTPIPIGFTVTAEPWLKPGTYLFFLTGSLLDGRSRAVGFEVKVTESSISDFILTFDEDRITAMEGSRVNVGLLLQSISGFSNEVKLSIPDAIDGLRLSLSETVVIPTSTVMLTIDIDEGVGPYYIRVIAVGGNLTREDILRLDTTPKEGSVTIIPSPGPLRLSKQEGTYQVRFNITLLPGTTPLYIVPIVIEGLPEGSEVTISPAGLRKLPYLVNITVEISTLGNPDAPFILTINVTPEGSSRNFREEITVLPYEHDGTQNGGGLPMAYILVVLAAVGIISGLFVLLLVSRRLSGHENGYDGKGTAQAGHRGVPHAPSIERPHGSGRGPNRLVRKH